MARLPVGGVERWNDKEMDVMREKTEQRIAMLGLIFWVAFIAFAITVAYFEGEKDFAVVYIQGIGVGLIMSILWRKAWK